MAKPAVLTMISSVTTPTISNTFVNNTAEVCTLQISGTFSSATVNIEGIVNVNSGVWVTLATFNLSDLDLKTSGMTGDGIYQASVAGILRVRINVTAVSGGNITVVANFVGATYNGKELPPSEEVPFTAYDYAVLGGYTGTETAYEQALANVVNVGPLAQQAAQSAQSAQNSANAAAASAADAESAAEEVTAEVVAEITTDWLDDHVDPVGSAVIVDNSLTISGAAADAKVTGDQLTDVKNALSNLENFCYDKKTLVLTKDYTIPNNNVLNTVGDPLLVDIATDITFSILLDGVVDNIQYTVSLRDANGDEIEYFNCNTGVVTNRTAIDDIKSIRLYSNKTGLVSGDQYTLSVSYDVEAGGDNSVEHRLNSAEISIAEIESDISTIKSDYYAASTGPKTLSTSAERNSDVIKIDGTTMTNSSYVHTQKISVTPGDVITAKGTYNTDTNFQVTLSYLCAYSGNTALSSKGIDQNSTVKSYTVPDGVDGIIITYLAVVTDVVVNRRIDNYTEYVPKIDDVEAKLEEIVTTSSKKIAQRKNPTVVSGYYVNTNGTINSNASYSYFVIDNLNTGDVVNVRAFYGANQYIVAPTLYTVCAYDETDSPVSAKGASSVANGTYTVPADIVKIAITYLHTQYTLESVIVMTDMSVDTVKGSPAVESAVFGSYPQEETDSLSVSDRIELSANSVKKNYDIIFTGDITSFNKLTIGRGTNDLNSLKVEIDGTNVKFYNGTSGAVTVAHNLTFSVYVSVIFHVGNDRIPVITILTGTGRYEHEFTGTICVGCNPAIYVETDGSTALTNCKISFVCEDIDQPLWIFGDSYVSFSVERWPYWIHEAGFDGYLLNGFSGESSGYAVEDLNNLLQYGRPKYLVWALGMNDADNGAVNPVWQSCFDEVCGLCNLYGITLIPCLIPSVPTRSNAYKDAVITESDYKYIDFASAVGALSDSTWYTGMLDEDGVHPTETGAYALASAVLKDFPYIAVKSH